MASVEFYPNTKIYVNLLNIRDQESLEIAEAVFSAKRNQEFYADPDSVVSIPRQDRFSLKHLCEIHFHQFQDVYCWAGIPRTFRMRKNHHREFSWPKDFELFAESIRDDISNDTDLFAGDIKTASLRLAHYMSMINIMHPFPEGNGRFQRAFIWLLARDAGYKLPWPSLSKSMIHAAAIRLMQDSDKGGIEHIIASIIEKA